MPPDARRVQSLFWEAVQHLDADRRRAVLERECPDDPELRARVEALLRAHDRAGDFLDEPLVLPGDEPWTPASEPDGPAPRRDPS